MNVLEVQGLCKSFNEHVVLDGVNFTVPQGKVVGFVGKNGAGKTTTMKSITSLLKPDSGRITICDKEVIYGKIGTSNLIGYLPDVPQFYNYMSARKYLEFCGKLVGIESKNLAVKVGELLEMVGLSDDKNRIGNYSRGMKQRLGVAQAIINEPKLLICDEPTSALDPNGRKEILDLLKKVSKSTSVLFSTHILSDVERICDSIAIMNRGKICYEGDIEQLKQKYSIQKIDIDFLTVTDAEKFVREYPQMEIESVANDNNVVSVTTTDIAVSQNRIMQFLQSEKLIIRKLENVEPDLESIYFEVTD